jgi:hypothetical protein
MTSLAPALAAAARSLACAFGTKSLARGAGYAGAGSSLNSSLTEAGVRAPLVLGSMGWGGAAAPRYRGGVAGGMAGDLCPKGMNRPASTTAKAAESRRSSAARAAAQRGTN